MLLHLFSFTQLHHAASKINQPVKIDGNLDDPAWSEIEPVTKFTTSLPTFGKTALKKSEVKIAYDNSAVYVGAYLYDNPQLVKKGLTQRDVIQLQDVDYFAVGLDTYNNNQQAFSFFVTAAGVQGDARMSLMGNSTASDRTWDAVWESKVSMKKDGWVVELKIPFSAIRFSNEPIQDWGLQFGRFARKTNEYSTWSPEDPAVSGTMNQWGKWTGLKDIMPPLRLSFLPYMSGGFRTSPTPNGKLTEYLKSGGMDVKYGINESFTLDMTLIPDFAQVQSDNVVLNLTPFEVKFDEYRSFFTEGTELFNKAGLFYSKRIGAQPHGTFDILRLALDSPQYRILKNPGITRLYNATKFSGRTNKNLGIGIFNALGVQMHATVKDEISGRTKDVVTEPLTNYNILVLDQALKNRSSVTFTNTNVLRNGNSRNANVSALDFSLFDKQNIHQFYVDGRYSNIWGYEGNSSGYKADISFKKVSGILQYSAGTSVKSDKFDPNDLGYLANNNTLDIGGDVSYNIFKPTRLFLNHRYALQVLNSYLYRPFNWQTFTFKASTFFLFKNFWDVTLNLTSQPTWTNDYFEPRVPGKFLKRAPIYLLYVSGSSDSRSRLYYFYTFRGAESPLPHDPYYDVEQGLRYRFSDAFQMSVSTIIELDKGNWGFGYFDPLSREPIIARRDVKTNTSIISANYSFNARMNMSLRMRHYWRQVHNTNFYDLKDDGYWSERPFANGYDQNFNTFNLDVFYTWDFLLGSRITVAWKNALGADVNIDGITNNTYFKNLNRVFDYPHSNELTLKVVYYLDYLTLKRKHS
ncbi:MAG: DUF5916 domain-containing protein [Ginsengibacter sp.]